MIDKIIDHINSSLADLVEHSYGLSEIIEGKDDTAFPGFYNGTEFIYVTNFDAYFNGLSYIRRNGTARHDYPVNPVGASTNAQINIPLKIVLFVPKKNLNKNDAYSNERIAFQVIKLISSDVIRIDNVKASRIKILTSGHDTDSESVLRSEYKGEIPNIDPKYSYLSVDFEIEILIDKKCINECCL